MITESAGNLYAHIDNIRAWIIALRSGTYLQTTNALKVSLVSSHETECAFCCLGVACDLVNKNGWTEAYDCIGYKRWKHRDLDRNTSLPTDEGYFGNLPPNLNKKFYGISLLIEANLVEMNDSGKSFTMIADYLEEVVIPDIRRQIDYKEGSPRGWDLG